MQVGDLVKHKHGTLQGSGVVLNLRTQGWEVARIAWTAHGQTKVHDIATTYLEVISESR